MKDSAAINTPHTKRYWAAAQRETPHNMGPQTYTYTSTHTTQNAFGEQLSFCPKDTEQVMRLCKSTEC